MREMKDSGIVWVNQIPKDWNVTRIKYLANSEPNAFVDGDWIESPFITDSGIRYYTTGNIGDGTFKYQGDGYISKKTYDALHCKYAFPGDLVFSRLNSPYGRSCIIPNDHDKCVLAVDIVILRTDEDKRYICYASQCDGYQHAVEDKSAGTTMKRISRTNLGHIKMPLPPLNEQKFIADYLDSKCSEIDSLATDIQAQIDTLEQYKRSIITEAVTKGLDKNVPMKDSKIPWVPLVPEHWNIYRIADLYEDRNERGNDTLPLLSVSINTGVSDRELSDEEQERVFLRSEDKTKYKRVYPGDITYNMMRAWQGAFGAVRVEGMVSPAYVVAKQTGLAEIDSRYIEALLRSPMGIEEMNRYSYGIMDFRKRLYWPQFRIIRICLPDIEEQRRIADYIDTKSLEIDSIVMKKKEQLSVLEDYKKSLIYEYVTGKKEVLNQ